MTFFLIFVYLVSVGIAAYFAITSEMLTIQNGEDFTIGLLVLNIYMVFTPFVNTVLIMSIIKWSRFFDFVLIKGKRDV
jgi:hypothetical protein